MKHEDTLDRRPQSHCHTNILNKCPNEHSCGTARTLQKCSESNEMRMNSSTAYCGGQIKCVDIHRLPELGYQFGFDVAFVNERNCSRPVPTIINVKQRPFEATNCTAMSSNLSLCSGVGKPSGCNLQSTAKIDTNDPCFCDGSVSHQRASGLFSGNGGDVISGSTKQIKHGFAFNLRQQSYRQSTSMNNSTMPSTNNSTASSSQNSLANIPFPSCCGGQDKIEEGDELLEIGSVSIKSLSLNEIEKLLRCSGSRLLIKVFRPFKPLERSIDSIPLNSHLLPTTSNDDDRRQGWHRSDRSQNEEYDCDSEIASRSSGSESSVASENNLSQQPDPYCKEPDNRYSTDYSGAKVEVATVSKQTEPGDGLTTEFDDEVTAMRHSKHEDIFSASNSADDSQLPDELIEAAKRLAKRLYLLDGFKAGDVAFELCKATKFSDLVAKKFIDNFEFKDIQLLPAFRCFLTRFTLPGTMIENDPARYEQALSCRERLIYLFCSRFDVCNPQVFEKIGGADACYVLVCSLLLLNTDLHGVTPEVEYRCVRALQNHSSSKTFHKKMSFAEFRKNLRLTELGSQINSDLLKSAYYSVKQEPLITLDPLADNFDKNHSIDSTTISGKRKNAGRQSICPLTSNSDKQNSSLSCLSFRGLTLTAKKHQKSNSSIITDKNDLTTIQPEEATEHGKSVHFTEAGLDSPPPAGSHIVLNTTTCYKSNQLESARPSGSGAASRIIYSSWLMRKCTHSEGGKKTSFMKRSWTRFYARLENLHLWFYRNDEIERVCSPSSSGLAPTASLAGASVVPSVVPVECVQIHHSVAKVIDRHKRRLNVFALQLATNCLSVNNRRQLCICHKSGAQFLFQARNIDEMHSWVNMINLCAALFSSAPFAPPVGSGSLYLQASPHSHALGVGLQKQQSSHMNHRENVIHQLPIEEAVVLPVTQSALSPLRQRQWFNRQVIELKEKLMEFKESKTKEDINLLDNNCYSQRSDNGGQESSVEADRLDPSRSLTRPPCLDPFGQSQSGDLIELFHNEIDRNMIYINCIDDFIAASSANNEHHSSSSNKAYVYSELHDSDETRMNMDFKTETKACGPIIYCSSTAQSSTLCTLREDLPLLESFPVTLKEEESSSKLKQNDNPVLIEATNNSNVNNCITTEMDKPKRANLSDHQQLDDMKCSSPSSILKRDAVVVAGVDNTEI